MRWEGREADWKGRSGDKEVNNERGRGKERGEGKRRE